MNPNVQMIVEQNNRGVEQFEKGMYDGALRHFCKALEVSKTNFSEQAQVPSDGALHEDEIMCEEQELEQSRPLHRLLHIDNMDVDGRIERFCSRQNLRNDMTIFSEFRDKPFVYKHTFAMSRLGHNSEYPSVCYAVVCMFNLALAHHSWAVDKRDSSGASLHSAARLYELSYCLMVQEGIHSYLDEIFTLALVNNLGQVYVWLKNEQKARRCFQHLLSILMFFYDYDGFEIVDYYEGFISNVVRFLLYDPISAAAA